MTLVESDDKSKIYLKGRERKDIMTDRKVLIVEDSYLQSKLYFIILSDYREFKLFFSATGIKTNDLMDLQKDIDLIISDINMPMM